MPMTAPSVKAGQRPRAGIVTVARVLLVEDDRDIAEP
jgi:hypothetical protein